MSRQIKELEDEIGKKLFIRSNKKIILTEEGLLLRQRAEEIVNLVNKTEAELSSTDEFITGEIYIGAGEARSLKIINKVIKKMQQKYPAVTFHIHSGNAPDILYKIDNGCIDFGILTDHPKILDYNYEKLPCTHQWGVLMRKEDLLAKKTEITLEDLKEKPLIVSKEIENNRDLIRWFDNDLENCNIIASYNLLFNASLMVEDEIGYAICFDHLIDTSCESLLCYRPLAPRLEVSSYVIWKKYEVLNKASKCFLEILEDVMNEHK